ncbi:MAG: hypothetical protein ACFBSC_05235 [Microcoleaceae cyanobacterium]
MLANRATSNYNPSRRWGLAGILTLAALNFIPHPAQAQSVCSAPESGEYLVLIVSSTSAEQEEARRTLPQDVESEVCQYLEDTVTRVGGFRDRLIAQDWANYVTGSIGLRAYVIRPDNSQVGNRSGVDQRPPGLNTSVDASTRPSPTDSTQTGSTTTRLSNRPGTPTLGAGYAILVDYLSQPELATQVEQVVGQKIGLVSYGQRPYLLAEYTRDLEQATETLQALSDRGFWSMLVESERVQVISSEINSR